MTKKTIRINGGAEREIISSYSVGPGETPHNRGAV